MTLYTVQGDRNYEKITFFLQVTHRVNTKFVQHMTTARAQDTYTTKKFFFYPL